MNDSVVAEDFARRAHGRTVFSLLQAAHALEDRLEGALGTVGLSSAKFSVLTELVSAREALSLSDLASRLSCVRSNMTQLVDRLEADGLVERVADPLDRRGVRAEITKAGREKQALAIREVDRLEGQLAEAVAESDRAAFGRMLAALR